MTKWLGFINSEFLMWGGIKEQNGIGIRQVFKSQQTMFELWDSTFLYPLTHDFLTESKYYHMNIAELS